MLEDLLFTTFWVGEYSCWGQKEYIVFSYEIKYLQYFLSKFVCNLGSFAECKIIEIQDILKASALCRLYMEGISF